MSEIADWIACQELWARRRGRPAPRTWSAARGVREHIGSSLTGKPVADTLREVRWTGQVQTDRIAGIVGRSAAAGLKALVEKHGELLTGYHGREYEAFEAVGMDRLTWWWIDIGTRPSPAAWLEAAEIAAGQDAVTHLGVIRVHLRAWPDEPQVSGETRPVALIAQVLSMQRGFQDGHGKAGVYDRTPGHHCARCPAYGCPVRS